MPPTIHLHPSAAATTPKRTPEGRLQHVFEPSGCCVLEEPGPVPAAGAAASAQPSGSAAAARQAPPRE
eukprot:4122027-Prymnesium_polylepis.1